MANVEVLGNVWRRVLDDDFLACARCIRAVLRSTRGRIICELVHLREYRTQK